MRRDAFRRALRLAGLAASCLLASCGGGGGGSSTSASATSTTTTTTTTALIQPLSKVAARCAAPRPASAVDPLTGEPYNDQPGSLDTEMSWIASYSNLTYLWYPDITAVSTAPYYIGATVPYVDPSNNSAGTETVTSNYQVVDAYFNTQRSMLFTASGKPKDQFHFTYVTTEYDALENSGNVAAFGFTAAILAGSPPRNVVVAYVDPGSPAAAIGITRGMTFLDVDGVDVVNGSDVTTLNDGIFTPTAGQTYTFTLEQPASTQTINVSLTAQVLAEVPVQDVGVLPAPNATVGYMLFNEHIATAEAALINAVTTLSQANGGQGITDLVLDLRYNGGGYLDIASELASMISSSATTASATFEAESFNNKNPFNFTAAEDITPFWQTSQGFSVPAGEPLPHLNLSRVFVIVGSGTCSASEAVINGLRGVGVNVIAVGDTTCGKPYGFYPQDNCSTTYFTIQFEGVNNAGFGGYADGFIPGGTGSTANNLAGCMVADDFDHALGDPNEIRLGTALYYLNHGACPAAGVINRARRPGAHTVQDVELVRPRPLENAILLHQRPALAALLQR